MQVLFHITIHLGGKTHSVYEYILRAPMLNNDNHILLIGNGKSDLVSQILKSAIYNF